MDRELYMACRNGEHEKALNIIQTNDKLLISDVNQALGVAVRKGQLETIKCIVDSGIINQKYLNISSLLNEVCRNRHPDIAAYLIELPCIGEYDINVILESNIWKDHAELKDRLIEKNSLIEASLQKGLRRAVHKMEIGKVKQIVESKDYFDLYPALYGAASKDNVELVSYLFEKANIRNDQLRFLLAASGPISRAWIENYFLRQRLGEDLEDKQQASRQKI